MASHDETSPDRAETRGIDEVTGWQTLTRRASVAGLAMAATSLWGLAARAQAGGGSGSEASSTADDIRAAERNEHFALADRDYGVASGRQATENARNLQRAVNTHQVVHLPGSEEGIEIAEPIIVPP